MQNKKHVVHTPKTKQTKKIELKHTAQTPAGGCMESNWRHYYHCIKLAHYLFVKTLAECFWCLLYIDMLFLPVL